MEKETHGMILGILGVISFGLTLPVTRFISPYFDPVFIGLGRAVIAAVFAGFFLYVTGQSIPKKGHFHELVVIALGVVVGFPVLSAWAMQSVPASHGAVVLGVLPLATAIVSVFISDDRPSAGFWVVGVLGGMAVVFYAVRQGFGSFRIGDIALLGAVISAAVGYAYGGNLSKKIGGWQVICWALVLSLPFIIIPAALNMPEKGFVDLPLSVLFGFLYLALVSQLLGFFLWNKGLALGGVARVSQVQLLQPFITIIASAVLLQEIVGVETIIFSFVIIGTVAIGKGMPVYQKT